MTFWNKILENEMLVSAVAGWLVAQFLKTMIDFGLNRTLSLERLVGSGGMPSSHSATVSALTVAAALIRGIESTEFAVCFVLSSVVMYDAIGVRQETGKQSKLLNLIMEQDLFHLSNKQFQQKLKEFVGHTPLQVLAGAVLGIIIAIIIHGYYI